MKRTFTPLTPIVISFSGGKDSSAMLAYICETYPLNPKYVIWANTGWEHDGLEEWNKKLCKLWNLDLIVVKGIRDFFELVERRKKFPGFSCRYCTGKLKSDPIQKWIRNKFPTGIVINAMGIRAQESNMRAKKSPYILNTGISTKTRIVFDWLPIFDWPERQVYSYLRGLQIPIHPIYEYLPRLSCQICIFYSKNHLKAIQYHTPKVIERIAEIEDKIEFTMFPQGPIMHLSKSRKGLIYPY